MGASGKGVEKLLPQKYITKNNLDCTGKNRKIYYSYLQLHIGRFGICS